MRDSPFLQLVFFVMVFGAAAGTELPAGCAQPVGHSMLREVNRVKHDDGITSIAFLGNAKTLATACSDGFLYCWSIDDRKLLTKIRIDDKPFGFRLAASNDGQVVFTKAGPDVSAWDMKTKRRSWSRTMPQVVADISPSANGKMLATVQAFGTLVVLDSASGKDVATFDNKAALITACCWHSDNRRIVVGSHVHKVLCWNLGSDSSKLVVNDNADIEFLRLSGNGMRAVTINNDRIGRVWDLTTQSQVWTSTDEKLATMQFIDHDILACGDMKGILSIWDIRQKKRIEQVNCNSSEITDITYDRQSKRIACACADGGVYVFEVKTGPK